MGWMDAISENAQHGLGLFASYVTLILEHVLSKELSILDCPAAM